MSSNREIMISFLNIVKSRGLLTKLIQELYDFTDINEYNYIYRLICEDNLVIIDIYDNFSVNRFNRYIFSFDNNGEYDVKVLEENNVFVTRIYVLKIKKCNNNNIYNFAYLFSLNKDEMLEYSKKLFSKELNNILLEIINKPTYL